MYLIMIPGSLDGITDDAEHDLQGAGGSFLYRISNPLLHIPEIYLPTIGRPTIGHGGGFWYN